MKKVLVHGCFDILHAGHLAHFKSAKDFGDYLVVSITTDRFVNKGPGRPYFTTNLRAEMVKALGIVDQVVISDHATAVNVIEEIKPDFYVKGPDYKDFSKDVTGEIENEKKAVERHGGRLVFTDDETFSSSTIINKFFSPWSEEQKAQIEIVKSVGGIDAVEKSLNEISRLNVLVVGEPIYDVYRFVNPEGISSKSPSVSARFQFEETYHGGTWAINRHLAGFAKRTKLVGDPDTKAHNHPISVPTKIRYISTDKSQRIFEVTHINDDCWNSARLSEELIREARDADVVIAADFGHGLFSEQILNAMQLITSFVGLNVQTNSSNFGYNVYTKHKRFDYLCLDTREVRLARHDRYNDPETLAKSVWYAEHGKPMSITLGSNGALCFLEAGEYRCPAFSDVVIDATGAGDAFFAITSCLIKIGCRPELIPFIGNVFAGLKTKIVGNKSAVSKAALLKACAGILK